MAEHIAYILERVRDWAECMVNHNQPDSYENKIGREVLSIINGETKPKFLSADSHREIKFAYYDKIRELFKAAYINSKDRYSGTRFNYNAGDLNKLLANPPVHIDECMVKCIIRAIEDSVKAYEEGYNDPDAFWYLDKHYSKKEKGQT